MKSRFFFDFFRGKKSKKEQTILFKNTPGAEQTIKQAKVIKLYENKTPVIKQAKIIPMFS